MPERMRVILKKDIAVRVQRAGGWCQWREGNVKLKQLDVGEYRRASFRSQFTLLDVTGV